MSRLSISFPQQPISISEEKSFAAELFRCMHTMACLVSLQTELLSNPELPMSSAVLLTQLSSAVEHRLLQSRPPPSPYPSAVLLLHEAFRLSQLMCISCIFRAFGASSAILRSLSNRLSQTLTSLEPLVQNVMSLPEKRMLAWILCVGGMASSDQHWYASRLAKLLYELKISDNEEWEALLSEFVWSPRMNTRYYDILLGLVRQSRPVCQIAQS
ncbi:hypothetical protein IQ07DRAFT_76877 [Pyrenochaeta sp. DS3sAY3a]|nr:hypothetical protein IQ07DRAFT_76877 [Pyrenochaeta sp. DS3sAY3a]